MPIRPSSSNHGSAIQLVESSDIVRVQQMINTEDAAQLEDYLREQQGRGFSIQDYPSYPTIIPPTLMVCFVERVTPNISLSGEEVVAAAFVPQENRVMGLPVIESSVFSTHGENSIYRFAVLDENLIQSDTVNGIRRLGIPSLTGVRLVRDGDSNNVVELSLTHNASLLSNLSDRSSSSSEPCDVVLLNDCRDISREGWTSLAVSNVNSSADVISFVMDMIPEKQRLNFIQEVDQLGWTSLHWASYNDDKTFIESAMSRLTSQQQREVMESRTSDDRGWTLLHTMAVKDSVNTMKALMQKFPGDDIKWNILSCKARRQGQTALHIAVAEKNVKAVIVLLDAADTWRGDLLNLEDDSQQSAVDYTSEFSLLGRYLRLSSTEVDPSPVLHKVVKSDDCVMIKFIREHSSDMTDKYFVSRRNANGRNLIQEACKCNSVKVLEYLTELLNDTELRRFLLEFSSEGDTAMHIAALYNKPTSLHILLKAVKKDKRLAYILAKNRSGETVEDVGHPHKAILDTLKYHRWICNSELSELFKSYEHSLFNISLPADKLKDLYSVIEHRKPLELGYKRNLNYDAAKCLRFGDLAQAEKLIKAALQVDPFCIHALCNKGVYLLIKVNPDHKEAEVVALKVLELFSHKSGKPRLYAKIDYAYWVAESMHTEGARERSCEIFEECITDSMQCGDSKAMRDYCSYFYVKILVRTLKSTDARHRPTEWRIQIIRKAICQLEILTQADEQSYLGDLWLWLAELQAPKIKRQVETNLAGELEGLRQWSSDLDGYDICPESCLNRAIDMREKYDYALKFIMRISKLCLDISIEAKDAKHWLENAIYWSKYCIERSENWYFMCSSTISKAQFDIWTIDYYQQSRKLVKSQYHFRNKKWLGDRKEDERKALIFLSTEYYHRGLKNHPMSVRCLGKVKYHLEELVNKGTGWKSHGAKLARVKYLLGDPYHEVVSTFDRALQNVDSHYHRMNALQSFGFFYEVCSSEYKLAEYYYKKAIDACHAGRDCGRPHTAINGLRFITKNCVRI